MKVVSLGSGLYGIEGFSRVLNSICKTVPGMAFEGGPPWKGYPDAVETTLALFRKAAPGVRVDTSQLPDPSRLGNPIIPIAEKGLREYQKTAVRFLITRGKSGVILGDAMGCGKTHSAVIAARALDSKTLIVCPNFVKGVWAGNTFEKGHIERLWPKGFADISLPSGRKKAFLDPVLPTKIVVINYEIFAAWEKALLAWHPRVLILDEGHVLVKPDSQVAQSISRVAAACEFRWLLSGTPLTNRIKDFWTIANILSPGRFGREFFKFGVRYCGGQQVLIEALQETRWNFDGESNLPELHSRLNRWSLLRRTAADVSLELPKKTRQIIWVEPRGAKSSPRFDRIKSAAALRDALDLAADRKLDTAIEYILNAAKGAWVVVGCYRRGVAESVAQACQGAGAEGFYIHGGVPVARRDKLLHEIRGKARTGSYGVLAVTLDTCATGIDLTFASVGCVLELVTEPALLLQFEARLHRYGQANPTLFPYILQRASADELIARKVINRLDNFERAIGKTGESLQSDLDSGPMTEADILKEIFEGVGV